jgi:TonB-linked SusC/RagA family outer membrane protein
MILTESCQIKKDNKSLKAKTWRVMKLTIALLLFFTFQAGAGGYAQRITIVKKNVHLAEVFHVIEQQTGYLFFYDKALIQETDPLNVTIKNATLEEALGVCLKDQNLTYSIVKNTVVIRKEKKSPSPGTQDNLSGIENIPPIQVHGTVRDENGSPLLNASVVIKGTQIGVTTNSEGYFTITVPNKKAVLVVSFTDYNSKEILVGDKEEITVSLERANNALNEVVVTALGIKREAKSLGYSTGVVNTDQIATDRTTNVGNSLVGKVAGVNVSAPTSGPGGSSKIRIRGQSSFGGNNSPLIIVNGIPINNTSISAGYKNSDNPTGGSSDGGDGLQSINPDDIESMTVLKGAAAAALYGYRAKDGAIIITTKNGSKHKGIGIELNTNNQISTALDFTDFQYEYGQGENGVRPTTIAEAQSSGIWSFGEKFDGKPTPQPDGSLRPYSPHKNRVAQFYRTGFNSTNSIALSGGYDRGNFRISFSNTDATGIVPNSDYHKKILNLGVNYNLTSKLSTQINANYSNEFNHNPPQIGIEGFSVNTTIYTMANSIDVNWLKNYKDSNGNEMPLARFTGRNNPYWVAYEHFENIRRDRIFGNASIRYQIADWLYMQGRIGQDYYTRPYEFNRPTGSRNLSAAVSGFNGYFYQDVTTFRERNLDFLIGATHKLNKFLFDLTVGGNQMQQIYDRLSTAVTNLYVRDLYTISNGQIKNPDYLFNKKKVNSLYGSVELSYNDYLFLNLTARNDWFSTLNPKSNSYLYPSINGSFIFSDIITSKPSWLNYGKIRAAYAEVGGDTDPYTNALYYSINPNTLNNIALGSINSTVSPNSNLRPLKVRETEIGMDLRLFNNRVNLNFSLYRKNTVDEILDVNISEASGYTQTKVNIGKLKNEGVEMLLTLLPIKGKINWESSFNAAYNKSEVLELANGQSSFDVGVGQYFGIISHEVGLPLASVRAFDYKRDTKGNILTAGGKPLLGNLKTYGSAIPKWTGGWTNNFKYKSLRIFTQIDFKAGAVVLSNSNFNFLREGLSKSSLEGREGGVVFKGYNADGTPNTTAVPAEEFYASLRNLGEPFIYNASFVRLRTISIGYDLSSVLNKTVIKGMVLSFFVNNALMIKKYLDNLDPESQISVSDNFQGIDTHSLPTTRTYGLNLNVRF